MLDKFVFEKMIMNAEMLRIVVALIGTGIATWYDVKNNKNVPDNFLYFFLAFSFILNILFFQQNIFIYGLLVGGVVFILGLILYKIGYVGGADVYVLASITLLLPIPVSYVPALFNFPPILSIIIVSGVLFALYFLYFIGANIVLKGKNGKYEYLLLLPVYGIMLYFLVASGIFGVTYIFAISILLLSSILCMIYKEPVMELMARKVKLSEVENEDVAVLELMPELVKKYNIKRLLERSELKRLIKLKLNEIYVYKELPPFLPFVFIGLIVTILFGDLFMHSIFLSLVIL